MTRTFLALTAVLLALSACSAPPAPVAPPATSAPAAALPSVAARGTGPYTEPCKQAVKLAAVDWLELAVRAAESEDLSAVSRAEVEDIIMRIAAVTPLLPPDVQQVMPQLMDPMVQLRGVLQGHPASISFGPGRDSILGITVMCGTYIPTES